SCQTTMGAGVYRKSFILINRTRSQNLLDLLQELFIPIGFIEIAAGARDAQLLFLDRQHARYDDRNAWTILLDDFPNAAAVDFLDLQIEQNERQFTLISH